MDKDPYRLFIERNGLPDPATASSVFFARGEGCDLEWREFRRQVGTGVFATRFLHVATPELPGVNRALASWSFLLPEDPRRQVCVRNAYGDLVLVTIDQGGTDRALVLSLRRARIEQPDVRGDFEPVLLFYLADADRSRIPGYAGGAHPFLDDRVFREFEAAGGRLEIDEALVPILPEPLGGRQELSNFRVERLSRHIVEVGSIYARHIRESAGRAGG